MTTPDLVSLHDLTVSYQRHPAVHHVSGRFAKGSLTALVGPNGAGKSTLLKSIAGLVSPFEGKVALHGISSRDIAYLPQLAAIDDSFPISVIDVVLMGLWPRVGAFGAVTRAMRRQAAEALAAVQLEGFAGRAFGSLSAGQRQRVLFARVMLADSPLILLDEPFSAVDARTTHDLLDLITRWHGEGRTVICVTHDFDQVRRHFPEALLMARRAIAWGASATVLSPENLAAARAMGESWSSDASICRGAA